MAKQKSQAPIVLPPSYGRDKPNTGSRAERTRGQIFKSSWLPAFTGESAETYAALNVAHLRDLYPLVWTFGPKADLIRRQLAAIQVQCDTMLALSGRKRTKLINEFVDFEFTLDEFMFEHGNDLGNEADNRIIHTFHYPRAVTPDLPLLGTFYPSHYLSLGPLPMINHGFNDAIVMFISMTLNMKRVRANPVFAEPLKLYKAFCERWQIPIE